jgi:hypothetical protein
MRLDEAAGFHNKANDSWETLRCGFEHIPQSESSSESNTCYICFVPGSESRTLAHRSVVLKEFLTGSTNFVGSAYSRFVVFIESEMLGNPATIVDITHGFLFSDPRDVVVAPGISISNVWVRTLMESISAFDLSPPEHLRTVFGTTEKYFDWFRTVVGLAFVRDLLRLYNIQKRNVPEEIDQTIRSYAGSHYSWDILQDFDQTNSSVYDQIILSATPRCDLNLRQEWCPIVTRMYNRQPPVKKRSPSVHIRENQKPLRARKPKRKYHSTEEDSEVEMDTEAAPVFVVENWLQCDECTKWRLVSKEQQSSFQDKFFQCSDVGKSCLSDPSDDLVNRT